MASIIGLDGFGVEYNITDGTPREVHIKGNCIYRTPEEAARTLPPDNIAIENPDWKEQLADALVAYGKNRPSREGDGYSAIAIWAEEQGLLELKPYESPRV